MSRILAALALIACSAFTACSTPVTAPQKPTAVPSTPRPDAVASSLCKSGWISSDGRCG